jgi:hypothetical protein
MTVPDARDAYFHELPEDEKDYWMSEMRCQPADDWAREVKYAGWNDVHSAYLVCEGDRQWPVEVQLGMAAVAGAEILRCPDGHMVQISNPKKVVEVLKEIEAGV